MADQSMLRVIAQWCQAQYEGRGDAALRVYEVMADRYQRLDAEDQEWYRNRSLWDLHDDAIRQYGVQPV